MKTVLGIVAAALVLLVGLGLVAVDYLSGKPVAESLWPAVLTLDPPPTGSGTEPIDITAAVIAQAERGFAEKYARELAATTVLYLPDEHTVEISYRFWTINRLRLAR